MEHVAKASDVTVCEGTGHCAVGSIVGLNNAKVASLLGADMVRTSFLWQVLALSGTRSHFEGAHTWRTLLGVQWNNLTFYVPIPSSSFIIFLHA